MSSVLFPVFPGLGYSVFKRPSAMTASSLSASGKRVAIARYSLGNPIWEFTLNFNYLNRHQKYAVIAQVPVAAALSDPSNLIADDVAALSGFFLARQGRYDTWLFEDPRDCAIAQQQIGVGDASSTAFQIVRQLGEYQEDIKQINGTAICAATWQANTLAAANGLLIPTPAAIRTQQDPIVAGYQSSGWPVYYQCTTPGRTGALEPRWRQQAPLAGMTITDGNVVWTCQGAPLVVYLEKALPDWAAGAKTLNQAILPLTGNAGGFTFICTTAGAGGAQPAWPQSLGATVSESGAVWTNFGVSATGAMHPIVPQLPSAYSLGTLGILSLNAAPSAGQQVFVTCSFWFRCEFKEDISQFELFMNQYVSNRSLNFRSVKI